MSIETADLEYREFFVDLAAIVGATLIDEGIAADVARLVSDRVIDGVRASLGGQRPYIPRNKFTIDSMRRVIVCEWHAGNTRELCQRLNITETRLRQLHAEGRTKPAAAKG